MNLHFKALKVFMTRFLNNSRCGRYQEVGGRRHGDPVVEELSCVVVHGPALFHRL